MIPAVHEPIWHLICYSRPKSNDTFTNRVILRIFDHALIIPIRCELFPNQEIGVSAGGSKRVACMPT
ncbi:uncharacterized protein LACBIDRAFT_306051 [Laccaria bicolor S238N-H82]|uniref:Predicted protein n=1 Tax=Laccaria bicolor (strain S238N-H82 / ATCC MYA-4686) TaxID=486041 RepID=B0CSL5_LACBS|nr:uncharacterized protein LACBIDRAFT_306051 [Laccaria bicolor S238N-H82]EDR14864.1 predicted protein [Laccaria bicolor S238N-H82]|eukprot:XP_001875423.1 predicted protein [Laccaria bicolor S238N-H82]